MKVSILIISCDSTTREANSIIGICNEVEEQLPNFCTEREELLRLVELAKQEPVHYSAADFFHVNRTTIFSILSVTATYFIIIIQFYQI